MTGGVIVVGISPLRLLHYYKFLGCYARLRGVEPDDFASWVMDTYKVDEDFIKLDVDVRELYDSYAEWAS